MRRRETPVDEAVAEMLETAVRLWVAFAPDVYDDAAGKWVRPTEMPMVDSGIMKAAKAAYRRVITP